MKFDFQLHGFDELQRALRTLPEIVQKRVIRTAAASAMREGRRAIRDAAPRHLDKQSPASKRYGPLYKNIRLVRLKYPIAGMFGARVDTGNAFWGYIYEIGSRYQGAVAWFAPAFRRAQTAIINTLGQKIGDGIDKEFLKAVKK